MFGDKQGLLHAVASRWRNDTLAERMALHASPDESASDVLLRFALAELELRQSPRTIALMRTLASEGLRDREFARQIYGDLHVPVIARLSEFFGALADAGTANIDDAEATARLFITTVSGDQLLSSLFDLQSDPDDEGQLRWRLQPFLRYFDLA